MKSEKMLEIKIEKTKHKKCIENMFGQNKKTSSNNNNNNSNIKLKREE